MSHPPRNPGSDVTDVGTPMSRRRFLGTAAAGAAGLAVANAWGIGRMNSHRRPPNIIFVLADDLGYGDLGCFGQEKIATPHLDAMAGDGVRFTQAYAGCTVCAPSRCCLMTGRHNGHTTVRGNKSAAGERVPLGPDDVTVAEVLRDAGYATGIFGKWGLGEPDTAGIPNRQGFDEWFGYLNQHNAHSYYPPHLWHNEEKMVLEANADGGHGAYSHDMIVDHAMSFIDAHHEEPFFLYLAVTVPHAKLEPPDNAPYGDRDWPEPLKNYAAMVTGLDRDMGRLFEKLRSHGIDEDTVVFFTSDNGPHREGGNDPDFFNSSGPLRGIKRDLYEGGIRVPSIARWPGTITPGVTSDVPWAFWDFLPTAADLAGGVPTPAGIDGISIVPALLGRAMPDREYLYWEFFESGFRQAVRAGDWKAVRKGIDEPIELYDLASDPAETTDVAAARPEVVARIRGILARARTESAEWPLPG